MPSTKSPPSSKTDPPEDVTPLLRNHNFILLWAAYAVSAMGDHLSEMAILKTQDALSPQVDVTPLTARMTFMLLVPFFVFAPLAGLLADRLPRRALMVAADVVRCVVLLFFAALIAFTQEWGSWGPFLPLLLVGTFACVFSPARSALLPTLIRTDQLVRANGLISGLGVMATLTALVIGGYLADRYHPVVSFRLDAATFAVSGILLLCMRPPRMLARTDARSTLSGTIADLQNGFRYVRTHRRVLELIAVAVIVWFCGPLVLSVIPAIVRDVYGGDYGVIMIYRAFFLVGFVLGAITIATLGDALRGEIAITWGMFGIGAGIAVFAASVFLPFTRANLKVIGAVGVVAAGVFGVSVMASLNALLQRIVPDRYRGRVFGVRDISTTAALLIATGALGVPQWTSVDRWVGYILIGVALVTAVTGYVTLSIRLGRGPFGRTVTFAENLNEFIAKFWWRMKRIGPSTIPREGPVIITANHRCSADPLFLHAAAPYRTIAFLVAAEYTTFPLVKFVLNLVECIPVKRDGRDAGPTKQAIRHLRAGKAMGIFIEGGIVPPGETAKLRDGVAMLALKTGARVIPAHISGVTYRSSIIRGLLHRHRVRVRFGPPVDLSEFNPKRDGREAIRAATRKIYAAIQDLAPEEDPEWEQSRLCRQRPASEPGL